MNHQKFANFILRQIKDGNEVKLPNISRTDYEKIKELLPKEQVEFDDMTQTFKPKKSTTTNATSTPNESCLLYTSPSPRDRTRSRMPSSA